MSTSIVAFDLETTGLDKKKDSIIQIAAIKFDPETKKIIERKMHYIQPEGAYTIGMAAYFKHGIDAKFLADKPHFREVAQEYLDYIKGCDILSFNGISFDVPFLKNEFERVGIHWNVMEHKLYDSFLVEKSRNGNRLEQTYERYYGKTMEESGMKAHDAFSDVMATIGVFYAQNKVAPVEPENIITEDNFVKMAEFQGEQKPVFSIGKYRDISVDFVATIDQGYLLWATGPKSDLCESTKNYLRRWIN